MANRWFSFREAWLPEDTSAGNANSLKLTKVAGTTSERQTNGTTAPLPEAALALPDLTLNPSGACFRIAANQNDFAPDESLGDRFQRIGEVAVGIAMSVVAVFIVLGLILGWFA